MTCVDFHSNLLKQIRKLPKILKSVKIIHDYSLLFIRVLNPEPRELRRMGLQRGLMAGEPAGLHPGADDLPRVGVFVQRLIALLEDWIENLKK